MSRECFYCQRKLNKLSPDPYLTPTKDHLHPKSLKDKKDLCHIVIACYFCNQMKGSIPYKYWKMFMMEFPNWINLKVNFAQKWYLERIQNERDSKREKVSNY